MNIYRGEIYWVNLDCITRYDHEQKGTRPCVVISNNKNNYFSNLVEIIPVTTKKRTLPTHKEIIINNNISYLIPENIITIDKNILTEYCGRLSPEELEKLDEALIIQLGLGGTYNE